MSTVIGSMGVRIAPGVLFKTRRFKSGDSQTFKTQSLLMKPRIKNFYPEADILQIKLEGYEIVVHRDNLTKEVYVDVRECTTSEEQNFILGTASPTNNSN